MDTHDFLRQCVTTHFLNWIDDFLCTPVGRRDPVRYNNTPSFTMASARQADIQRFFVAGVSRSITSDDLRTHFSRFGNVVESRIQRDAAGLSLGYGWIGFDKPCSSLLDIEHRINGQVLDVQIPRNRLAPASTAQPPPSAPAPPSVNVGGQQRPVETARAPLPQRKRSRSHEYSRRRSPSQRRRSRERSRERRPPPPPGPPPPLPPNSASHHGPMSNPPRSNGAPQQGAPHGHFNPPSGINPQYPSAPVVGVPPLGEATNDFFVCVPSALCPPQYMRDPRVFFAQLDGNGQLRVVPLPLGGVQPLPQLPPQQPPVHAPPQFQPPPPPQGNSQQRRYY